MRAFLLGFAIVYALLVGAVLSMDEAARPNNPWTISFALSVLVVPVACGWAAAECAALVLRRRVLEPGRSHALARAARGMFGAVLGASGAIVLAALGKPEWPDYVRMAITAFPAALLMASVGRSRREWACGKCGYDLRGLTRAAKSRCPECGEAIVAA